MDRLSVIVSFAKSAISNLQFINLLGKRFSCSSYAFIFGTKLNGLICFLISTVSAPVSDCLIAKAAVWVGFIMRM